MTTAFVLGNGRSRVHIKTEQLKQFGPIYACNAIYREFAPDVLVATDRPIATAIQESGYSTTHRFYTRNPLPNLGALKLHQPYRGYSSGPNAVGLACLHGYHTIYMIGFDLGTANGQFNNIYADTEFYKKSSDAPTFSGNWIKQIQQLCNEYGNKQFIRVVGKESMHVPSFSEIKNMRILQIEQFQALLNTSKGML